MLGEKLPGSLRLVLDGIVKDPKLSLRYLQARLGHRTYPTQAVLTDGQVMQVVLPDAVSSHLTIYGDFEPEVSQVLARMLKPDMSVYNVGSHIGLRLVQASKLIGPNGKVLGFEPTPRTFEVLSENVKHRSAPIDIYPMALGNYHGRANLSDYGWCFSGSNTCADKPRITTPFWRRQLPPHNDICVTMTTMDNICTHNPHPDLVVIDTEGNDLEVIRGGINTILANHPGIIFEAGDIGNTDTRRTIAYLNRFGYEIFNIPTLTPHTTRNNYAGEGNLNLAAIHPQHSRGWL